MHTSSNASAHVEKDSARDDPREPVPGDDEEPDAPQVGKEQVDVLEGHVLVGLPHRPVDLDVSFRPLGDLQQATRFTAFTSRER